MGVVGSDGCGGGVDLLAGPVAVVVCCCCSCCRVVFCLFVCVCVCLFVCLFAG